MRKQPARRNRSSFPWLEPAQTPPANPRARGIAHFLKPCFQPLKTAGHIAQDQHIPPSYAGILALVRSQQQIAQRKAILYFTHGRPMDSRAKEALQSIIGEANRTGISIYVVDLKGLDRNTYNKLHHQYIDVLGAGTGMKTEVWREVTGAIGDEFVGSAPMAASPEDLINDRPLKELAENTAGIYVGADDSLRKSLERMIQEMSIYYEAKYIPPTQDYDGKFSTGGCQAFTNRAHRSHQFGLFRAASEFRK